MAYNILPKSEKEIKNLKLDLYTEAEVLHLFNSLKSKMKDPIALQKNTKIVKVHRMFNGELNLKSFNFKYIKPSFGNGSRGNSGANNRGNLFEDDLCNEINQYIDDGTFGKYKDAVLDIIDLLPNSAVPLSCKPMGALNQKRTLSVSPSSIVVGKKGDIGKTVTDLDLIYNKSKNTKTESILHLSLKLGGTVTLVNAGVSKILNKNEMETGLVKNSDGKAILNMLGIDNEKFCAVFNDYTNSSGNKKEIINVKNKINKNLLNGFMESVIGYGYVLVHKLGNKVHVQEITKQVMTNFINIKTANLIYPLEGNAKRIDLKIEMNGIDIKLNIRNKQGGVYPTHIMADYVIKH